jgi:hypothetical protein
MEMGVLVSGYSGKSLPGYFMAIEHHSFCGIYLFLTGLV